MRFTSGRYMKLSSNVIETYQISKSNRTSRVIYQNISKFTLQILALFNEFYRQLDILFESNTSQVILTTEESIL